MLCNYSKFRLMINEHNVRIMPKKDKGDEAFWMCCKTFEWVDFHHLEIPEANRCPEIWDYVASSEPYACFTKK